MILTKDKIKKNQLWLSDKGRNIAQSSEFGYLLSDPTRIKILMLLNKHKEICVSDLATIIGVSISAISHQLSYLEKQKLTISKKYGKTVCYYPRISNKKILKLLPV